MRKRKVHYLEPDSNITLCGRNINTGPSHYCGDTVTCKTCLKILERNKCNPVSLKSELSVKEEKETLPGCFGKRTQESEECNKCKHIDQCVDKLWDNCGESVSVECEINSIDWGFWGIVLIITIAVLSVIIWG